jgi:hypothetical protein
MILRSKLVWFTRLFHSKSQAPTVDLSPFNRTMGWICGFPCVYASSVLIHSSSCWYKLTCCRVLKHGCGYKPLSGIWQGSGFGYCRFKKINNLQWTISSCRPLSNPTFRPERATRTKTRPDTTLVHCLQISMFWFESRARSLGRQRNFKEKKCGNFEPPHYKRINFSSEWFRRFCWTWRSGP